MYGRQEGFKQLKWPSRSLKVIDIDAIRKDTWQAIVLVFYSNYVSTLTVCEILSSIYENKRSRDPYHAPFGA